MTDIAAKMAELSARFAVRAGDERDGLQAELAADDRFAIRDRAHKLAGIAAMFGHADVGAAALELETAVEEGDDITAPASLLLRLLDAIAA